MNWRQLLFIPPILVGVAIFYMMTRPDGAIKMKSAEDAEAFVTANNIAITGRRVFRGTKTIFIRDPDRNVTVRERVDVRSRRSRLDRVD